MLIQELFAKSPIKSASLHIVDIFNRASMAENATSWFQNDNSWRKTILLRCNKLRWTGSSWFQQDQSAF